MTPYIMTDESMPLFVLLDGFDYPGSGLADMGAAAVQKPLTGFPSDVQPKDALAIRPLSALPTLLALKFAVTESSVL